MMRYSILLAVLLSLWAFCKAQEVGIDASGNPCVSKSDTGSSGQAAVGFKLVNSCRFATRAQLICPAQSIQTVDIPSRKTVPVPSQCDPETAVVGAVAGPRGLPSFGSMKNSMGCIAMTELGHINICLERLRVQYTCSNSDGTMKETKSSDVNPWTVGDNSFQNSVIYDCDDGISTLTKVEVAPN